MDIEVQAVLVFTVGGNESVLGIVQVTQEALVERQSGTQDSADHQRIVRRIDQGCSQWGLNAFG